MYLSKLAVVASYGDETYCLGSDYSCVAELGEYIERPSRSNGGFFSVDIRIRCCKDFFFCECAWTVPSSTSLKSSPSSMEKFSALVGYDS